MDLEHLIDEAAVSLTKRINSTEGFQGTLDTVLGLYGDYGITLSCVALFKPTIKFKNDIPFATFSSTDTPLPIDCFHVDLLHHSSAENQDPVVFNAIGEALAIFWTQQLKEKNQHGYFEYDDTNGYDVIYCI